MRSIPGWRQMGPGISERHVRDNTMARWVVDHAQPIGIYARRRQRLRGIDHRVEDMQQRVEEFKWRIVHMNNRMLDECTRIASRHQRRMDEELSQRQLAEKQARMNALAEKYLERRERMGH